MPLVEYHPIENGGKDNSCTVDLKDSKFSVLGKTFCLIPYILFEIMSFVEHDTLGTWTKYTLKKQFMS